MSTIKTCLIVLLLCVSAAVQAQPLREPQVIVISMDGMRWDFPNLGVSPALKRMENEGFRATKMIPTFPSNTFPGHASMATGTRPEKHGIVDNRFYDTQKRKAFDKYRTAEWLEAEPIWVTAERQGKKAAVYYWLGSEGAWRGVQASYFKERFQTVLSEQRKVDQIIAWMDLPAEKRPALIMTYWHGVDSVAHKLGPNSDMVASMLARQDGFLQQVLAAIDARKAWPYTTVIVVSDHGMTEKGKALSLQSIFEQGKFQVWIQKSAAVAQVNLKDKTQQLAAFQYLKKFNEFDVYYPATMPKNISINHATRSGDLVLVARPGFYFSEQAWLTQQTQKLMSGGVHGYPPEHPDMGAIFFAKGRGVFPKNKHSPVNMIDVAPTIAALLGIELPLHAEGKSVFSTHANR